MDTLIIILLCLAVMFMAIALSTVAMIWAGSQLVDKIKGNNIDTSFNLKGEFKNKGN